MTAERKQDFGSGYLYAEDLLSGGRFRTATVEISEVHKPGTLTAANGKRIDKWVIGFKGKDKKLCLSANTNVAIIHLVTGEHPGEAWIGHSIKLQARVINAFGGDTLCIRVIPPRGTNLRKSLIERMGVEATYTPTKQPPKPQTPAQPDQPQSDDVSDQDIDSILGGEK